MRSWTGRGTLGEVRHGSGDPRGGLGRVGGLSRKSRACGGKLGAVRDVSRTIPVVLDASGDTWGGPACVVVP